MSGEIAATLGVLVDMLTKIQSAKVKVVLDASKLGTDISQQLRDKQRADVYIPVTSNAAFGMWIYPSGLVAVYATENKGNYFVTYGEGILGTWELTNGDLLLLLVGPTGSLNAVLQILSQAEMFEERYRGLIKKIEIL